jgi:hypothetical protein
MERLIGFIAWVLVGACFLLAGCRLAITAEKLEASAEIYRATYEIGPPDEPTGD